MGLYSFINSLLAGLFFSAALYFLLLWRQSRGERILLVVGIQSIVCAAFSICLVALARVESISAGQQLLDARCTLGLLVHLCVLWLLSFVTGVKARPFVGFVTAASLVLIAVNILIVPLNGTVTGINHIELFGGEVIASPQHHASWLMWPAYILVLSVQAFGMIASFGLWKRNALGGFLVLLTCLGTFGVMIASMTIDFFQTKLPYVGASTLAPLLIVIALMVSREYRSRSEKLEESEGGLRAIFDHTIGFIGLIGVDGTLIRINRTALKFAGLAEQDVAGKLFWETPWWRHSPALQARLREAVQSSAAGNLVQFEAKHIQQDGQYSHIDYSLKPVRNPKGEITYLIAEGRDITARKEAEKKLIETSQFNKQIIESAPDGLIVLDREFRYRVWNPKMEEISGLPASQVLGKRPMDLFPFLERTDIYQLIERVLAGETVTTDDFPFDVPSTGRTGWTMQIMGPLRNAQNEVIGVLVSVVDITHRKATEQKLLAAGRGIQEAHALLDTLQTAAPIGLGFVDTDFRYVLCNGALAEINGLAASDHIGRHVWEVVPKLWPRIQPLYEQVRAGKGPIVNREVIGETAARPGTTRFWQVSYYPVAIGVEMIGTGIIVSEITEQKRVEEALRRSEARGSAILRALPDLMFRIDRDGTIVDYSANSLDEMYVPPSEFLGQRVLDVLPPEMARLVMENLDRSLETRQSQIFEYHLDIPAKGTLWFEARMVVSGEQETISIVRNITRRKAAEAMIEQERLQLAGIINSAMDGIITIDESQRIVLFNAAAERIFRYRAEEMLNQPVELLVPQRVRSGHAELVRQFGESNNLTHEMGRGRRISGLRADGEEFPIEASISQIVLNGRKLFTVTCRDVTERMRATETRQKLEAQLLQSQKMEAIGLLAGGVAHDFNNLLTVITGYTEVLLDAVANHQSLNEPAQAIKEASMRAAALTRQLLVFSRQRVSEARILDLNAIVRDAEKMLRRVIGEDIRFIVSLDRSIDCVKGELAQLNQVLMNLVVNARDAMPKGGTLTIETHSVSGDCGLPHLHEPPEKAVVLTVADTGTGMTPEVIGRIFEPFYTTKGIGKGTGLGLAVVHGIVEQCGGRIEVESKPWVGTTFRIYLPAVADSLPALDERDIVASLHGTETILLVEDDEAVRKLALFSLRSHGYRVLSAVDGQDALRIVDEYPNSIDILLTDVVMPNIDGLDLAKALNARFPSLKILFMSGYSGDAINQRNTTPVEMFLLQKPYTPTSLLRKVREVLEGK